MPKAKTPTPTEYPEISDIREDLNSLKTNVVELTKHLKKDGVAKADTVKDAAIDRYEDIAQSGKERVKDIERRVKQKPAESIAIAFAAGLVTSFLLGRR